MPWTAADMAEMRGKLIKSNAEIKRLRDALKPFSRWAMHPSEKPTLEDCNRAFRALKDQPANVRGVH